MVRPRHVPHRTCVVCKKRAPKRELVRVVASGGRVSLDPSGRASGRGAYVCRDDEGGEARAMRASLARALRTEVADGDWKDLKESLGVMAGTGQSE